MQPNGAIARLRGTVRHVLRVRLGVGSLFACGGGGHAAGRAIAAGDSLYQGPGPRPGPDILYSAPATAPQLENAGDLAREADPGLGRAAPTAKASSSTRTTSTTITGPRGPSRIPAIPARRRRQLLRCRTAPTPIRPTPAYANNAADLVELRVKPLPSATAFRLTLNSHEGPGARRHDDRDRRARPSRAAFPYGANATAPAQLFLTVHGDHADLRDAATGQLVTPAPTGHRSRTAAARSRCSSRIRPGTRGQQAVRLAAGVGLWNTSADRYLRPGRRRRRDAPGRRRAGSPAPTAFFNVAFRFTRAAGSTSSRPTSVFTRPRLVARPRAGQRARQRRPQPVPRRGRLRQARRAASRTTCAASPDGRAAQRPDGPDPGQPLRDRAGRRLRDQPAAAPPTARASCAAASSRTRSTCPHKPAPPRGYGLTLLLHSLGANYNQFSDSRNQSQLGERGPGSIVITPEGRGPDGWYYGHAGADTFEVWADVARRYRLDPGWTAISGYSMGGYGTYKFATQFPDLFARAKPVVGPPGLGVWVPPAATRSRAARPATRTGCSPRSATSRS